MLRYAFYDVPRATGNAIQTLVPVFEIYLNNHWIMPWLFLVRNFNNQRGEELMLLGSWRLLDTVPSLPLVESPFPFFVPTRTIFLLSGRV